MSRKHRSIFDQVIKESVPQSDHDLSYTNDCTMKIGMLTPIAIYETVPGDIFFGGTAGFLRTEPLVTPMLTPLDLEIRYFYVPNRFVWDEWRDFLTNQRKGVQYGTLLPYNGKHPTLDFSEMDSRAIQEWCAPGSLADFLGVPSQYDAQNPEGCNALPFRMYNLIYNEFFRDENLITPAIVPTDNAVDSDPAEQYVLRRVCWRKDRFTSALPWPQKGEDVNIDTLVKLYGGRQRVDPNLLSESEPFFTSFGQNGTRSSIDGGVDQGGNRHGRAVQIFRNQPAVQNSGNIRVDSSVSAEPSLGHPAPSPGGVSDPYLWFDPNGSLSANISVRRIRQASALQRILEKKALAGSRYSEYLLAMYGVRLPDSENGRPMYLGGGCAPITVHPVEQTSATGSGSTPQGNLAGKGVGVGAYRMSRPTLINDFGYIMGLAYIRPRATYFGGMRRSLMLFDRDNYYNPDYQLIGEEMVDRREIYYRSNYASNDFGYQSRYAYLKSKENEVHGNLKSDMLNWIMPHVMGTNPTLNGTFVQCAPNDDNNFAVGDRDHYIINFYNEFRARRPMYFLPVLKNGQI